MYVHLPNLHSGCASRSVCKQMCMYVCMHVSMYVYLLGRRLVALVQHRQVQPRRLHRRRGLGQNILVYYSISYSSL